MWRRPCCADLPSTSDPSASPSASHARIAVGCPAAKSNLVLSLPGSRLLVGPEDLGFGLRGPNFY